MTLNSSPARANHAPTGSALPKEKSPGKKRCLRCGMDPEIPAEVYRIGLLEWHPQLRVFIRSDHVSEVVVRRPQFRRVLACLMTSPDLCHHPNEIAEAMGNIFSSSSQVMRVAMYSIRHDVAGFVCIEQCVDRGYRAVPAYPPSGGGDLSDGGQDFS